MSLWGSLSSCKSIGFFSIHYESLKDSRDTLISAEVDVLMLSFIS